MNDFIELWKMLPSRIYCKSPYTGNMLYGRLSMTKIDKGGIINYTDSAGNCFLFVDVPDDDYISALNKMKLKLQQEGFM